MSVVSAIYAKKQIESAVKISEKGPLFSIVGLTEESAQDPSTMVPVTMYHALLEVIAQSEWPDIRFHMKTCQSMQCDEFGAFGLAFKSAPTLRHAFHRIWRYTRLHNQVSQFSGEQHGNRFRWSMRAPLVPRLGCYLSSEAAMATTLTLCRETTHQDLTPCHVQFAHEREGSIDALVEHFGRVPVFGAEMDAIEFSLDQVDQPCMIGDPAIWKFLTDHLDQVLETEGEAEPEFEARVMEEIVKLLSGGVPQITDVSQAMGLGSRTFQRRLQERGKSFKGLIDEARQQLALQLVGASSYPLSEVAFLTGFSEQSAFSRAFKRWSGQSPRAYRTEVRAG